MFTGIVEHVGTIESVELCDVGTRSDFSGTRSDQIGASIRVNAGPLIMGLEKSGSIAVNGCCLTAIDISAATFAADLSGETLRRTSLGEMKPGMRVNLERPLTALKELGGHFVQGHVDGVGRVTRLESEAARELGGSGSGNSRESRALHRDERLHLTRRHQPHSSGLA